MAPQAGDALPPGLLPQLHLLLRQRGQAWLLYGPSGLGQLDLARWLARSWLCEQAGPGEGRLVPACGRCASCHAIDVHTHADLLLLLPESQLLEQGWPLPEKAQTEIDEKKRKPSREIRIEAMRDAIEFAQRTSARGRGKVVLIYPAERMNAVTANALLKTLEEPAGDTRFVLASEASHALLPTIRSRCIGHAMAWPEEHDSLAWLQQQGLAASDAQVLLRAAGLRVQDALSLARAGLGAAQWRAFPAAVARGDVASLQQWAPADLLTALQKLCHDLLATKAGASPRYFDELDLSFEDPPHARPKGSRTPSSATSRAPSASRLATPDTAALSELTAWGQSLRQAARSIEHPLNPGLLLEHLVAQAHRVLHSSA